MEMFNYTYEFLVGNLFILLSENNIKKINVTNNEIYEFARIFESECKKRKLPVRPSLVYDETSYDYDELFFEIREEIYRHATTFDSILLYKYRLHDPKEIIDVIESEDLVDKVLKKFGFDKPQEKHIINVQHDIDYVNEQIDYRARLRQFELCMEYENILKKLENIKYRFPHLCRNEDINEFSRTKGDNKHEV